MPPHFNALPVSFSSPPLSNVLLSSAPLLLCPSLPARFLAALVVDYLGDLLGADAVVARLAAHAELAAQRHGVHSVPAQAVLDVCLLLLEGMGGLLETACSERCPRDPPPEWLGGEMGWVLV